MCPRTKFKTLFKQCKFAYSDSEFSFSPRSYISNNEKTATRSAAAPASTKKKKKRIIAIIV